MRLSSTLWLTAIFCLLFLFTACEKEEPIIAAKNQEEFSAADQQMIGARLTAQVGQDDHNFPLFKSDNPAVEEELTNYMNSLIRTVAISVPVKNRNNFDWKVTIIDREEIHLFSAPGGHFFVYTGLLKALDSEAELIGLLGHELKYVDASKTILSLKNEFGGVAMGDILLGRDVAQIDNMALWLRDLSYSEDEVLEADQFAIDVLCPYLYNNHGLSNAITRLSDVSDRTVEWLEKRPGAIKRLEVLENMEMDCGQNEKYFAERYMQMVAKL